MLELTDRWQRAWPECPPIGYLFKSHLHDRWVRFHSLPGSKRYPDDEAEYQVILHRHNTILSELDASEIYLITVEWGTNDLAAGTEPIHTGLHPNSARWMRVVDPDDPEVAFVLHASRQRFEAGNLDALLRDVADDQAAVIVADIEMRWLYHPYDGGADVILSSALDRDLMKIRHSDWLSARSDGM